MSGRIAASSCSACMSRKATTLWTWSTHRDAGAAVAGVGAPGRLDEREHLAADALVDVLVEVERHELEAGRGGQVGDGHVGFLSVAATGRATAVADEAIVRNPQEPRS